MPTEEEQDISLNFKGKIRKIKQFLSGTGLWIVINWKWISFRYLGVANEIHETLNSKSIFCRGARSSASNLLVSFLLPKNWNSGIQEAAD